MELPTTAQTVANSIANLAISNVMDAAQGNDRSVSVSIAAEDNPFPPTNEVRKTERWVLEDFTQCSKSHLWKLMMSFYDRKGPDSWSQGIVPHFITCNTFIGKSYAQVNINVFLGFYRLFSYPLTNVYCCDCCCLMIGIAWIYS